MSLDKNTGEQETLLSQLEVTGLFSLSNINRCLIFEYEIRHLNNSVVAPTDTLFNILQLAERTDITDPSIEVNTTVPMTDGTVVSNDYSFFIVAKAEGNIEASKRVDLSIVICGSETVDHDPALTRTWTLDILPTASVLVYNFEDLFSSSDPYCPPINFRTVMNTLDTQPTTIQAANFYLISDTNLGLFPQWAGVYNFYIRGSSITNRVSYAEFTLTVQCVVGSQTMTITPGQPSAFQTFRDTGFTNLISSA
jgi:hypothetical protein